jgi:carbamoyltransferase
MTLIGINESHGSSVVVMDAGRAVFALQDERVNRRKNASGFPHDALRFTLEHLSLAAEDLEAICLSNLVSPVLTRDSHLAFYDRTAERTVVQALADQARRDARLALRSTPARPLKKAVERVLGAPGTGADFPAELALHGLGGVPLKRTHHHLNHAASAYFGLRIDPDEPYLVLTLDGGGDEDCARVYRAQAGELELLARTAAGHSLGNIYGRVTHLMGMTPLEHEYKLMGLAPYADPAHAAPLVERLRGYLDLDPTNPLCFKRKTRESTSLIEPRLARDFPRARFDSFAAAIQTYTEELVVRWVQAAVRETGIRKVLAAGGVFMNVKANKLISELPEIEHFDVFPSCGDESLPFGALWLAEAERTPSAGAGIEFDSYYLGPDASYDLAEARTRYAGRVEFRELADADFHAARLLAEGRVVARCTGRMEFGARALGNRSILADPAKPDVVDEINKMIKQRDFWMPFAPALLREGAEDYVRIPSTLPDPGVSPYMMHTFDTTERRREFPAAIHRYDQTTRALVLTVEQNPALHRLISEYDRLSGKSIVLNTSFNLHGFPIVMGACDAVDVMLRSSIEHLIVNDTLVTKTS